MLACTPTKRSTPRSSTSRWENTIGKWAKPTTPEQKTDTMRRDGSRSRNLMTQAKKFISARQGRTIKTGGKTEVSTSLMMNTIKQDRIKQTNWDLDDAEEIKKSRSALKYVSSKVGTDLKGKAEQVQLRKLYFNKLLHTRDIETCIGDIGSAGVSDQSRCQVTLYSTMSVNKVQPDKPVFSFVPTNLKSTIVACRASAQPELSIARVSQSRTEQFLNVREWTVAYKWAITKMAMSKILLHYKLDAVGSKHRANKRAQEAMQAKRSLAFESARPQPKRRRIAPPENLGTTSGICLSTMQRPAKMESRVARRAKLPISRSEISSEVAAVSKSSPMLSSLISHKRPVGTPTDKRPRGMRSVQRGMGMDIDEDEDEDEVKRPKRRTSKKVSKTFSRVLDFLKSQKKKKASSKLEIFQKPNGGQKRNLDNPFQAPRVGRKRNLEDAFQAPRMGQKRNQDNPFQAPRIGQKRRRDDPFEAPNRSVKTNKLLGSSSSSIGNARKFLAQRRSSWKKPASTKRTNTLLSAKNYNLMSAAPTNRTKQSFMTVCGKNTMMRKNAISVVGNFVGTERNIKPARMIFAAPGQEKDKLTCIGLEKDTAFRNIDANVASPDDRYLLKNTEIGVDTKPASLVERTVMDTMDAFPNIKDMPKFLMKETPTRPSTFNPKVPDMKKVTKLFPNGTEAWFGLCMDQSKTFKRRCRPCLIMERTGTIVGTAESIREYVIVPYQLNVTVNKDYRPACLVKNALGVKEVVTMKPGSDECTEEKENEMYTMTAQTKERFFDKTAIVIFVERMRTPTERYRPSATNQYNSRILDQVGKEMLCMVGFFSLKSMISIYKDVEAKITALRRRL